MSDKNIEKNESEDIENNGVKETRRSSSPMNEFVSKITKQTIISSLIFFVVGGITVSALSNNNKNLDEASNFANRGGINDHDLKNPNSAKNKQNRTPSNSTEEDQEDEQNNNVEGNNDNDANSSDQNDVTTGASTT